MSDQKPTDPAPTGGGHPMLDALRQIAALPLYKSSVLILLGSLAWFLHSQGPAIVDAVRRPPQQPDAVHARALTDAVVRGRSLDAILAHLLEVNQASRASLWQFHNGTSTLAGIPFLKTSQTNVATAAGVASLQDRYQGLPLQLIIEWIPRLLSGECIDQEDDTASASLRQLMRDGNVDRLLICPVFIVGLREPVGYLALTYSRGWPQPSDLPAALASLRASSVAAGAVLAAYRDSQRR